MVAGQNTIRRTPAVTRALCHLAVVAVAVSTLHCADEQRDDVPEYTGKPYHGTLARIREEGILRVITPDKEFAALPRRGQVLTFETDMAQRLARRLGVDLSLVVVPSYDSIIPWLAAGQGDVAMASLTITESRRERVDFSSPLGHVRELLVGPSADTAAVHDVQDLSGRAVVVRRSSSYHQTLSSLKDSVENLTIVAAPEEMHTHEIVHKVAHGDYPLTVCDSDIADAVMEYEDGVSVLLPLTEHRPRGWAVAKGCDTLRAQLDAFILEESLAGHRRERHRDDFDGIRERRALRVATRNNAATYWIYRGKEVGFEYELCRAFADKYDLRLEMLIAPDRGSLLDWVDSGKADIAAATLTATEKRKQRVAFCAPYLFPVEVVVSGRDEEGDPLVDDTAELATVPMYVRKSSSYYGTLTALAAARGDSFDIRMVPEDVETEEILRRVADGEYAATVCDDYLAHMEERYTDAIAIGPPLTEPREVGWVVRSDAVKLKSAIDSFFTDGAYKPRSLKYNILYRRYFKSKRRVAMARSDQRSDVHGKLSVYDGLMKTYAKKRGFDWRMIAAQTYQESKFNPKARSWVGAQGLMQLMPATARELGVADAFDPNQNVRGGTRYMARMMERFDPDISYRDRYHLALASYNAGYGHVQDARRLAEQMGWNPNVWFDSVEKAMLLLSKREYARKARYGYVRGSEPVTYVGNIQRLYNHYSQIGD